MNNEETFLKFLVDKIKKAKNECNTNIGTSSFNKPHIIGNTDGHTITKQQIYIIETYGEFLNKIPKQYYEKYAKLICKEMDFYNTSIPHQNTKQHNKTSEELEERTENIIQLDLYEEYRTDSPNKVRKRVLKKVQNLREELESVEEDFSEFYDYNIVDEDGREEKASMSEEEIKGRIKDSEYYTLVYLLDKLAKHLNGNKNDASIAPYSKFYPPYKSYKKILSNHYLKQ